MNSTPRPDRTDDRPLRAFRHAARPSAVIVALVLIFALAGCLSGSDGTTTQSPSPTTTPTATALADKPTPSSLDSTLYQLTRADDPTAYAERHDLTLENDTVVVLVRLAENRSLPATVDVRVTAREGSRVEGYVPIDRLRTLATHENVTFVEPPDRPELHARGPQ